METFDGDDRQAHDIQVLGEGWVLGEPKYRAVQGRLMENLSYDLPMPVDPAAWRSIVEPDEPTPAELYDRRNGLGRHWGQAERGPSAAADLAAGFDKVLKDAGIELPPAARVAAPLVLALVMMRKTG